ncbi:MAG: DUF2029 domain-containing protein [Planctomycetes bacterium]|nr:DUF2029 domain-containing protein [Planctomycetota bacterium]
MDSARTENRLAIWTCRVLLFGVLVLLALPVFIRGTGDWETVYLSAARNLRNGDDLLDLRNGYVYPPFGALVAVPFTFMPRSAGLVAWAALNSLAVMVVLVGAWRLSGGRSLPGRVGSTKADYAAFWLGGLAALGFMLDAAANWQTDLLIAAALIVGCLFLARGRSIAAGLMIGFAAAFKCTPLLFVPYLMWKRQFLAAAVVVFTAFGLNLLPDLAYPQADGQSRLVVWKVRFLTPLTEANRDPGVWASGVDYNHSVAGATLRWFGYERIEGNGRHISVPKAERPSTSDLKRLNFATTALLGLVALVALWRRPGDITPGPVFAVEVGIVLTLMLLLSPMSSKPHFAVLIVPQLALVRLACQTRDWWLLALTAVVAIAGPCTGNDIIGRTAYDFLVWHGLIVGMTVLLFVGCCRARYRAVRVETPVIISIAEPEVRRAA